MRLTEEEYKALIGGTPPKKSKYKNDKPTYYDPDLREELKFDSNKERDYYLILKDREKRGEIRFLNRQYKIEIQPAFTDSKGNKIRAITYRADFYFYDRIRKSWRIIDVKGFKTDVYKLKYKLLLYKGIEIEEV